MIHDDARLEFETHDKCGAEVVETADTVEEKTCKEAEGNRQHEARVGERRKGGGGGHTAGICAAMDMGINSMEICTMPWLPSKLGCFKFSMVMRSFDP